MVLLLSANAFSFSLEDRPFFGSVSPRPVELFFFVDNKNYLSMNFLEVTVPADNHQKHIVKLKETNEPRVLGGRSEWLAPPGDLNLVVCGLVTCPQREEELQCSNVRVPSQIATDRRHEITFSTDYACRPTDAPPSLTLARPSVTLAP
jgi:hypothetical protein